MSSASRVRQRIIAALSTCDKVFLFTSVLKHSLFVYALLLFFFKACLIVYLTLSGCYSLVQFVDEWCVSEWDIIEHAIVLIRSMLLSLTRTVYLFTVMTPRWLFVFFFFLFFFGLICVAFVFYFWLVGSVLYSCWPCFDLMLPNPIQTEPLKEFETAKVTCYFSYKEDKSRYWEDRIISKTQNEL